VYQQAPTAPEGNFFRRATFRYWRPMEPWPDGRERLDLDGRPVTVADAWRFLTIDPAASVRTSADWTVISAWALSVDGYLILLDRVRARVPEHDHFSMALPLMRTWGAGQVFIEKSWWSTTLVSDAHAAGVPVAPLAADTDKITRAIPAAGRLASGRVYWPAEAPWLDEWMDELAAFPRGAHDDQVDTFSSAARVVSGEYVPPGPAGAARADRSEAVIAAAHADATGDGHGGDLDLLHVPY
jgi:predicted phage terminase large subunit-like protein